MAVAVGFHVHVNVDRGQRVKIEGHAPELTPPPLRRPHRPAKVGDVPHGGDLLSPEISVREGDLLWTPSPDQRASANITRFTSWLATGRQQEFASYDALCAGP